MEKRSTILLLILFLSFVSFELSLSIDFFESEVENKSMKKSLTESFSMEGMFQFNATGYTDMSVYGVKSDSEGKLVVATSLNNGSYYDIGVFRFNADGTPDLTFGGGDGIYIYPDQGYHEYVGQFDVDSQGNIYIAGHYYTSTSSNDRHPLLIKLNNSGTLDIAIEPEGQGYPRVGSGCVVTDDGKVYFTSWGRQTRTIYDSSVYCFQADTLDLNTTFADDGIADWLGTWAWTTYSYNLFLDGDGNIYVWGYDYQGNNDDSSAFILRYLEDGSLDTTFGGQGDDVSPGIWEYPDTKFDIEGSQSARAYNLYADSIHNYIYVRIRNYSANIFTMRLYYNGIIDTSFADNGIWDPKINGVDAVEIVKSVDTDGNIYATGNVNGNATILKLDETGDLITEFGNNGIFWYNSSETSTLGDILTLPDNSMIVVGKIGTNGALFHISSSGELVKGETTTTTVTTTSEVITSETTTKSDTTESASTSFDISIGLFFAMIILYSLKKKRR